MTSDQRTCCQYDAKTIESCSKILLTTINIKKTSYWHHVRQSTSIWRRINAYDVNMMLFWHIWRRINAHVVNMMSFWHLINDAVNWKGWNQMKCSSYIPSQWHITPGILLSTAYSSNLHYLIVHFQYSSFIADNKHSIHPLHLDKLRNSYLNHFMIFAVYKNENISLLFTYLSPYF